MAVRQADRREAHPAGRANSVRAGATADWLAASRMGCPVLVWTLIVRISDQIENAEDVLELLSLKSII